MKKQHVIVTHIGKKILLSQRLTTFNDSLSNKSLYLHRSKPISFESNEWFTINTSPHNLTYIDMHTTN